MAPRKERLPLFVRKLDSIADCDQLAATMAEHDQQECLQMGMTPKVSLAAAALLGNAYAVIRRKTGSCVGAYGCSLDYGTIWSLWAPLGLSEQKLVLQETPRIVAELQALQPHKPLFNYVSVDNERVLRWLEAAGCFTVWTEADSFALNSRYFEVKL